MRPSTEISIGLYRTKKKLEADIHSKTTELRDVQNNLVTLYSSASEKYQEMLDGEYKNTPIAEIPCPCCGSMTLRAVDVWIYMINECTSCGWGMYA